MNQLKNSIESVNFVYDDVYKHYIKKKSNQIYVNEKSIQIKDWRYVKLTEVRSRDDKKSFHRMMLSYNENGIFYGKEDTTNDDMNPELCFDYSGGPSYCLKRVDNTFTTINTYNCEGKCKKDVWPTKVSGFINWVQLSKWLKFIHDLLYNQTTG